MPVLLVVRGDAFCERVAVNADGGGSSRKPVAVSLKRFLDVNLFEFRDGFVEKYLPVEHFVYQPL